MTSQKTLLRTRLSRIPIAYSLWLGLSLALLIVGLIGNRPQTLQSFEAEPSSQGFYLEANSLSVLPGEFVVLRLRGQTAEMVSDLNAVITGPFNNWQVTRVDWPKEVQTPRFSVDRNQQAVRLIATLDPPAPAHALRFELILEARTVNQSRFAIECARSWTAFEAKKALLCGPRTKPLQIRIVNQRQARRSNLCLDEPPAPPTGLTLSPGPDTGEMTVAWHKQAQNETVAIEYGTQPDQFPFAIPQVHNRDEVVISQLNPGQTYFVTLRRLNGCSSSSRSFVESLTLPPVTPSPQVGTPSAVPVSLPKTLQSETETLLADWSVGFVAAGLVGLGFWTFLLIKQIVQKPKFDPIPILKEISIWE